MSLIALMTLRSRIIDDNGRTFTISVIDLNRPDLEVGTLISLPSEDEQNSYASCASPTWTPDGKSILFSSFYRGANECGIYKLDLSTKRLEYLFGDTKCILTDIRLSPSGEYLAYKYLDEDGYGYAQVGCMFMKNGRPSKKIKMPYDTGVISCRNPIWKNANQLYVGYGKKQDSGGGFMLIDVENEKIVDIQINEIHLPSHSQKYLLVIPTTSPEWWTVKNQESGEETKIQSILRDNPEGRGIGFDFDSAPNWAPDDEKFLFVRHRTLKDDEMSVIFLYDAEESKEYRFRLTYSCQPVWCPTAKGEWDFNEPVKMDKIGYKRIQCFIATAAYRSEITSDVIFLCSFRDQHLLKSYWGHAFVRFYYFISPPIASMIARSERLSMFVRKFIISPIVKLLRYFLSPTYKR